MTVDAFFRFLNVSNLATLDADQFSLKVQSFLLLHPPAEIATAQLLFAVSSNLSDRGITHLLNPTCDLALFALLHLTVTALSLPRTAAALRKQSQFFEIDFNEPNPMLLLSFAYYALRTTKILHPPASAHQATTYQTVTFTPHPPHSLSISNCNRTFLSGAPSIALRLLYPAALRSGMTPLSPLLMHGGDETYCLTALMDPKWMAELMSEGYLPIATVYGDRVVMMPKLHEERCVIRLDGMEEWHVSKNLRKKGKKYKLTLNTAFPQVCQFVNEQHGPAWLYPEMIEAYTQIQALTNSRSSDAPLRAPTTLPPPSSYNPHLHMYSVELWNAGGELVAGEIGYTLGSIYASLTGFTRESGAGSMQLAALGALLFWRGYRVWDLGMGMDYKSGLGATMIARTEWRAIVKEMREEDVDGLESWRTEVDLKGIFRPDAGGENEK